MRWNKLFLFLVFILTIAGLLVLYSATRSTNPIYFTKQFIWDMIGIFIMFVLAYMKPKFYYNISIPLYILSIILLILVFFVSFHGVHRWIDLKLFRIQPSEIAKLSLILILARYVQHRRFSVKSYRDFFYMILLTLPLLGLVLIEPDLGTSTVFGVLLVGIMFLMAMDVFFILIMLLPILSIILSFHKIIWLIFVGLVLFIWVRFRRNNKETVIFLILIVISGIMSPIVWNHLKEYQRNRIISFINPSKDPLGYGWHLLQSEIAVGSGGVMGKGYLKGTQKGLNFIPQHHTDFIFSTVGEEMGFMGSVIFMGIIFFTGMYLIYRSYFAKSRFSSAVLGGFGILFLYQAVVNIGMVLGLLPVVGLPLPFFSYGGSSSLLFYSLCGIALSIMGHRYENI